MNVAPDQTIIFRCTDLFRYMFREIIHLVPWYSQPKEDLVGERAKQKKEKVATSAKIFKIFSNI